MRFVSIVIHPIRVMVARFILDAQGVIISIGNFEPVRFFCYFLEYLFLWNFFLLVLKRLVFFFLFKFFRQICIKLVAFFFLFVFLCALYVVLCAIYCKRRKLYVFRVLSNWEYCCCSFVVLRKRSKVRCVVKGIGVWNRLCEYTDASIFFHSQSIPSHPFSNKNDSIIGEV